MFASRSFTLSLAVLLAVGLTFTLPIFAQETLYDNGPDGNVGYDRVNFGAAVSNSFTLTRSATVTSVNVTLYSVDDRNPPLSVKWTITTEAFGGEVKGEGFVNLDRLRAPYLTRFQFFAWPMGFGIPDIALPAGTYYLQIQDVVTRWDSYSFWAQSSDGTAQGYYKPIGGNGAGGISEVPSESFSVLGQWISAQTPQARRQTANR